MAVTSEIEEAIAEIEATFAGSKIDTAEDGGGGAYVVVDPVGIAGPYKQDATWIGFQISFQYPFADVYPHFVRGDLERSDGATLGEGMSPTNWRARAAIQVSRRSNNLNPAVDTAALKLLKVLEWLRSR